MQPFSAVHQLVLAQLLHKVDVHRKGFNLFGLRVPLIAVEVTVNAALFKPLMRRPHRYFIVHGVVADVRNRKQVHHPTLNPVVPLGVPGQSVPETVVAVVTAIGRGFRIMKSVFNVPPGVGPESKLLHHVDLRIRRWDLQQGVALRNHHIGAVLALHKNVFDVVVRPVTALAQVVVVPRTETGHHRELLPSHVHIEMARLLAVGR